MKTGSGFNPLREREAVIIQGCRIPFQRAGTGFRHLSSYDMGRLVLKSLLHRSGLDPGSVDHVIFGTVISAPATSNVARESALAAGMAASVSAHTVTQACISSNRAITEAVDLVKSGSADVVIAGGTESMSDIPIRFRKKLRQKMLGLRKGRGPGKYVNFIRGLRFGDLLPEIPSIAEYSTGRSMGEDCDRLAARFGISRRDQDEYALRSHLNAWEATENGVLLKEIEGVRVPPDFNPIQTDNGIRPDSTMEQLSALKPAFVKPFGTLTAGNSSFLTDGAAATLIMNKDTALELEIKPRAVIRSYIYTAQDPEDNLLLGPAFAIPRLLNAVALPLSEIDLFEFHEAFAAQVLANLVCLNSRQFAKEYLDSDMPVGEIPMDRLNTRGGSLSIGHPFGATGSRLVNTAVNRLEDEDGHFAIVASCAAGAMGSAILLERYTA